MKRPNFLPQDDYLDCWLSVFSGFGAAVLVGLIAWVVAIV